MDQKHYAIVLARKLLAESVFNMSSHEGNPFTFVEVQTLLDGVTVGGRKLSDHDQVLRISNAWKYLLESVETETFALNRGFACALHGIVGEEEALTWGEFRDRNVSIAGTDYTPPSAENLPGLFDRLINRADDTSDVKEKAIGVFLGFAKNQFFYDGNKRVGQLLMNGLLLEASEVIISIPAAKAQEYNENMIHFYDTGNETAIREFLSRCQERIRRDLER